ncbi:LuxR C-terminal-related transcriptional regulator [Flavobacterium cerinum]|uniref:Response regulator transcription factor n=1 Tax=Flavobacterium cerinum TaxID=2502784 RepID=A0A3S3RKM7_9FLAO|nr:response regulator transcription factor [Flavobacterium cerinum]
MQFLHQSAAISIHTVNTHRQRILVKLDADNAMEAVKKASALGLLA